MRELGLFVNAVGSLANVLQKIIKFTLFSGKTVFKSKIKKHLLKNKNL